MRRAPKNDKGDRETRLARVRQMAVALTEMAEELHETACAAQSPRLTDLGARKLAGRLGQQATSIDVLAQAIQVLSKGQS